MTDTEPRLGYLFPSEHEFTEAEMLCHKATEWLETKLAVRTVQTLENMAQISGLAFCYFVFRLAELWNRLPLLLSCLFFSLSFFYFSILNYKWNWAKQAIFMLPHLVCVLTLFVCWQHFMRFLSLSYVIVFDNVFSVVLCYQGVLRWLIWVFYVLLPSFLVLTITCYSFPRRDGGIGELCSASSQWRFWD